jgi:hypothetical protein
MGAGADKVRAYRRPQDCQGARSSAAGKPACPSQRELLHFAFARGSLIKETTMQTTAPKIPGATLIAAATIQVADAAGNR